MFGWGALTVTDDQRKCWAETASDPANFTQPCSKPAPSELGLCPVHYQEITGRAWEDNGNSYAGGASRDITSDAPA
jgi:hypothetical protein